MKPTITNSPSQSLPEVHGSVSTTQMSFWRRMLAFTGPAYLISVGYMDPGNWATDLEGGARFGYQLIWVLVLSNAMAILLQTLSARLGIVTQRDLAQACRESYPPFISSALWILCEIAIAACDLAEVLGAAIALNLLFHIPLLIGVMLTVSDTLFVLWFSRYGIRVMEMFVLALILVITGCFVVELWMAKPAIAPILGGLVPRINDQSLYVAIGILGATVMPHNLYLHSALVQTRHIGTTEVEKQIACRFNFLDSFVALNGALIVNASILILSAAVFYQHAVVTEIQQAHALLAPLLGTTLASVLFAVALLASGQSSTLTGTLAGQIVMEGFLELRMKPWLRRVVTRAIAVVPAAITIWIAGDKGSYQLLILSQVVLSLQLPFAVIPLIQFTGDKKRMGSFANRPWVKILAWSAAVLILALNLRLAWMAIGEWAGTHPWLWFVLVPCAAFLLTLLAWIALEPYLPSRFRAGSSAAAAPLNIAIDLPVPHYRKILVPLDHSEFDRVAIAHAAATAKVHGAKIFLLHIEEGVTSQLFGSLASTAEIEAGKHYFGSIVGSLVAMGIDAEIAITHSTNPKAEIVRFAKELKPDLIVMGAHGHTGFKDLIFGTTINAVRHALEVPILVVRHGNLS